MPRLAAVVAFLCVVAGLIWMALAIVENDARAPSSARPTRVVASPGDPEPQSGDDESTGRRRVMREGDSSVSISGRVTQGERPVAVPVEVTTVASTDPRSAMDGGPASLYFRLGRAGFVSTDPPIRTQSDASGAFVVRGLAAGNYRVTAIAESGARVSERFDVTSAGAPSEIDLVLPTGEPRLRGRVEEHDGTAFRGQVAFVEDVGERWMYAGCAPESLSWRPSGEDGSFAYFGDAQRVRIVACEIGRRVVISPPIPLPQNKPYTFRIQRVDEISGRVVSAADGHPVARAELLGVTLNRGASGPQAFALAAADSDGRFTIGASPSVSIIARAEGYSVGLAQPTDVGVEIEVLLSPLGTVTGRVIRADDGTPIGGVLVHAHPAGRQALASPTTPARSAVDGSFTLEGVHAGRSTVFALGGGWASVGLGEISREGANPLAVELEPGGRDSIEVRVEPSSIIVLRIEDATGVPVAGATVESRSRGPAAAALAALARAAQSDDEGRIRLVDMVPGAPHEFVVSHATSDAKWIPEIRVPSGATVEHTVTLARPRTLTIRVVDTESGAPIAGAAVAVKSDRTGVSIDLKTDADGVARARPAPTAGASVEVTSNGYVRDRRSLVANDEDEDVVIRLVHGVTISGRVVGTDGEGVPGARVRANVDLEALLDADFDLDLVSTLVRLVNSDADGRFRFDGLPSTPMEIAVSVAIEGVMHMGTASVANGGEVEIVVEPFGPAKKAQLVVTVVDDEGRPVPLVHILHSSGPGRFGSVGARDGGARFSPAPKDDQVHLITVSRAQTADGRALPLAGVVRQLRASDGYEIEIRLRPELAIDGRVVDTDGVGVRGVRVRAIPHREIVRQFKIDYETNDPWSDVLTSGDGAFRLGGLDDGEFLVKFDVPKDYAPVEPVLHNGGAKGIEVVVSRGTRARVSVTDDAGEPVADAVVTASSALRTVHAYTSADGVAVLIGLAPAATYRLNIRLQGDRAADAFPFDDDEWSPADTAVRLQRSYSVRGTIRDPRGDPVPGAAVWRREGTGARGMQADAAGRFRIVQLRAGEVIELRTTKNWDDATVDLSGREGTAPVPGRTQSTTSWTSFTAGDTDARMVLDVGERFRVSVDGSRDTSRKNKTRFVVRDLDGGLGVVASGSLPRDAVLHFCGLRNGDQRLLTVGPTPDGRYGRVEISAPVGDDMRLTLTPGEPLVGELSAPEGVSTSRVNVRATGIDCWADATTDDDGRFRFPGLPPGAYRVSAAIHDESVTYHGIVNVNTGESAEIRLEKR